MTELAKLLTQGTLGEAGRAAQLDGEVRHDPRTHLITQRGFGIPRTHLPGLYGGEDLPDRVGGELRRAQRDHRESTRIRSAGISVTSSHSTSARTRPRRPATAAGSPRARRSTAGPASPTGSRGARVPARRTARGPGGRLAPPRRDVPNGPIRQARNDLAPDPGSPPAFPARRRGRRTERAARSTYGRHPPAARRSEPSTRTPRRSPVALRTTRRLYTRR